MTAPHGAKRSVGKADRKEIGPGRGRPDFVVLHLPKRCSKNLSWRPGHGASAQQVDVQMFDGLAAIRAGVDHQTVAIGQMLFFGDLTGCQQQMAQQCCILLTTAVKRSHMLTRNHQNVHRSLRINVCKGVAVFVLVSRF